MSRDVAFVAFLLLLAGAGWVASPRHTGAPSPEIKRPLSSSPVWARVGWQSPTRGRSAFGDPVGPEPCVSFSPWVVVGISPAKFLGRGVSEVKEIGSEGRQKRGRVTGPHKGNPWYREMGR